MKIKILTLEDALNLLPAKLADGSEFEINKAPLFPHMRYSNTDVYHVRYKKWNGKGYTSTHTEYGTITEAVIKMLSYIDILKKESYKRNKKDIDKAEKTMHLLKRAARNGAKTANKLKK